MELSNQQQLFRDPYKYKYSRLYTNYILGISTYNQVREEEGITSPMPVKRLQHSLVEKYRDTNLIPIDIDPNGVVVLGYTDGVTYDESKLMNCRVERISICDYFRLYEDLYGRHEDILELPVNSYTDSIKQEAIRLKAADITQTVRGNKIIYYYNIAKSKVYSNIKIDKYKISQVISALLGDVKYSSDMKEPDSGKCRISQDGKYFGRWELVPTNGGDCMVTIRVTEVTPMTETPKDLGLSEKTLDFIDNEFGNDEGGLRIIGGPTMSGKNTTICAVLNKYVREDAYKIVSIEQPIERTIEGVEQIDATGKDLKKLCDAMIRCNPDIVYPSELNDRSGRSIIDLANNGKITFSTCHFNSVATSFLRLERITGLHRDELLQLVHSIIYQELIREQLSDGTWIVKPKCRFLRLSRDVQIKLTGLNDRQFYEEIQRYECGDAFRNYQEKYTIG